MPGPIKLDRVVTYHEGLPPINLHDHLIMWYCEITRQYKTTTVCIATKFGRMVTYLRDSLIVIQGFDHVV